MSPLLKDHLPGVQEYKQFNQDERLRAIDEAHQRYLHDLATDIEEAHERGRSERDMEIARNLKLAGSDLSFIAQMTGLSLTEIERLN